MKGLICKRALSKRLYSAKATYTFRKPTNLSHPISNPVPHDDWHIVGQRQTTSARNPKKDTVLCSKTEKEKTCTFVCTILKGHYCHHFFPQKKNGHAFDTGEIQKICTDDRTCNTVKFGNMEKHKTVDFDTD